MKKKNLLFIILLMMTVIIAACSGEEDTESAEDNETEGTQDSAELVVSLAAEPASLDPHAANDGNSLYVMNAMYDTLVRQNTDLKIEPALAKSLEQIEPTVWEAKLREGVTFHDGSPFNAEVVKANLDRVRDPEIGSPLAFLFDMIDSVDVVDTYTVHITTEFPFSALPAHLAHPGGHMISLKSIEADYEAIENGEEPFASVNEAPIGTGYFQFESRSSGENVVVTKNENYWGEPAGVDSITFKFVPEDLTRVAELQTGDSHIIYPVNANNIEEIDASEDTYVKQTESASMTYVGFNMEKEPFNNEKVRQAIAMAINKDEIIGGALNGIAQPANGPLAPTVFGYTDSIESIEFDVDEAKELLVEAGYPDGFTTSIMVYDTNTSNIAEIIQAQLAEIGVEVSIDSTDIGTYLDMTGNGDSEMYVGSWGTVTLDADYGLYPMFHSVNAGNPGNRSFYASEEVDQLLEQARQAQTEEERLDLYAEAQQLIVNEAPIVPIYHSVLLAGLRENVDGFFQYPSSFPYLKDVTIK